MLNRRIFIGVIPAVFGMIWPVQAGKIVAAKERRIVLRAKFPTSPKKRRSFRMSLNLSNPGSAKLEDVDECEERGYFTQFERIEFKDLERGDTFLLLEPNGTPVHDAHLVRAIGYPYLNDEGRLTISCMPITQYGPSPDVDKHLANQLFQEMGMSPKAPSKTKFDALNGVPVRELRSV